MNRCRPIAMLVGVLLFLCATSAGGQAPPTADSDLESLSAAFEAMISRVSPAVVKIFVSGFVPQSGIVPGTGDLISRQRSTGSGALLDPEGFIITNAHVVVGARRVQVLVPPGSEQPRKDRSILQVQGSLMGAQVVGVDLETDLAVLKVAATNLPHLELKDSDEVRKGQLVFAFGSPLGLENSVSMGVVSSVARQLRPEDPMIYIQTDATINPGNSGGPLVDASGRMIGVNTMILSQSGGSEGIGFAAPSNIVRNVYEQIRARGFVRRGIIGVHAQTVTPTMAAALRLSRQSGVILADVYPDGPADQAGLRIGDLILSLDGKPMENGRQLDVNLYARQKGTRVRLEVLRGSEVQTIIVETVERPDFTASIAGLVSPERNLLPELGILALDLDARIERMLPPLRKTSGVVVAARAVDAPFWERGVLPGDVIYAINGQEVRNLKDLRQALGDLKLYDPVVVQVERDGQLQYVTFELE